MKKVLLLVLSCQSLIGSSFVFRVMAPPEKALENIDKSSLPDMRLGGITFFYAGSKFFTAKYGSLTIPITGGAPKEFWFVVAPEVWAMPIEDSTVDHIKLGAKCDEKNTLIFKLEATKVAAPAAVQVSPEKPKEVATPEKKEADSDEPQTLWTFNKQPLPKDGRLPNMAVIMRADAADIGLASQKFTQIGRHVVFPDIFLIRRSPSIDESLLRSFGNVEKKGTRPSTFAVHSALESKQEDKKSQTEGASPIKVHQVASES